MADCKQLEQAIGQLDAGSETSHKILSCHVPQVDGVYNLSTCTMAFASDYVADRVAFHLLLLDRLMLASFLQSGGLFSDGMEAFRGRLFERLVHLALTKGGMFPLRWLPAESPPPASPEKGDGAAWTVSTLTLDAREASQKIQFKDAEELARQNDIMYCVPTSAQFPAVDSVLLLKGRSFLFQSIVAKSHPESAAGLERLLDLAGRGAVLFFVVAEKTIFDEFKQQPYTTSSRILGVDELSAPLAKLRQCVLHVDLAKVRDQLNTPFDDSGFDDSEWAILPPGPSL